MSAESSGLTHPADPTIGQVFDEFLAEQRRRLKPGTLSKYERVISLLGHHLDGYAYEGLSEEDSALFDKHYSAEGEEHREFCELFGPEHIVPNLDMFLSYFMVRKVMAGAGLKRAAGTVTKKLAKWLAEKGYVDPETAQDAVELGAEAARNLPDAERAAQVLYEAIDDPFVDPDGPPDEDYLEFDHFTISRIEPGQLWLEHFLGEERVVGPIPVPSKATELLRVGWDISCALARIRGKWRIVEVANVYPH